MVPFHGKPLFFLGKGEFAMPQWQRLPANVDNLTVYFYIDFISDFFQTGCFFAYSVLACIDRHLNGQIVSVLNFFLKFYFGKRAY